MMWRLLTDLVRETVSTLEREWSAGEWVESMQEEIERNEGPENFKHSFVTDQQAVKQFLLTETLKSFERSQE